VTDFLVVNVHVDELLSARIWQHKLVETYSANVNINNRLPIKVIDINPFLFLNNNIVKCTGHVNERNL
jgi:hypothetical protein